MLLCCDIVDSVANRSVALRISVWLFVVVGPSWPRRQRQDRAGSGEETRKEEEEQQDAVELSSQSSHIPRKG
jgi:hypothetical protein